MWKEIKDTGWKVSDKGEIMRPNGTISKFRTSGYAECKFGFVHRIVAYYFCNPPKEVNDNWVCEGYEVHHKDLNPRNNRADNLVYVTHEEHKEIHKKKIRRVKQVKQREYVRPILINM